MGTGIQTRGCGSCGGTMYRTWETDENGDVTGESQYVCTRCGAVD